ncbi:MAG: tRNA lysidine(34) synthetase TilS, partial [Proteobacteria bacterium]
GDISQKQSIWFLACSGGVDSMVLLTLASDYAKRHDQPVAVVHVNYGLRGEESNADADFVAEAAARLALPFHLLKAPANPKGGVGIQSWARQIRYDWFHSLAGPNDKILLAHHRDDLIETILMRIMRGSSLHGLMGMKRCEGRLVRPLLDCPRSLIEEFARAEGISYREDSSNAKLDYSRNRLRHSILPELQAMFPGAGQNILELARSGQAWSDYFQRSIGLVGEPQCPSDWKDLGFYPSAQFIVSELDRFLNDQFSATKPSRHWLQALYEALVSGAHTIFELDMQTEVKVSGGQFAFQHKDRRITPSARWAQYERELTKSGLISRLSPGSTLDAQLDEGSEMQDNKNAKAPWP